jgi:hypothetical protein
MRRSAAVLLVCAAAAGCNSGPFEFLRPAKPAVSSAYSAGGFGNAFGSVAALDQVPGLYVESVLFERPLGEPTIDRDLWENKGAFLPPKTRTLLEENGLRVAVFGGAPPRSFQKLLESRADAVDPRRLTFANRTEAVLPTDGPIEKCECRLLATISGESEKVEFHKATCGLMVQPKHIGDGRVHLRCEPQVQHGERHDWIRPTADGTGFALQGEFPVDRYPALGFEATLSPGEYLIVGAWAERADSLGSAMFTASSKNGEAKQRVLVIRAGYRGDLPSDLPALPRSRGGQAIAVEANRW